MNIFRDLWDKRSIKRVTLGIFALFITILLGLILYNSAGFWRVIFQVFSAITKPLALGLLFSYLLSPIVAFFERYLPIQRDVLRHNVAVAITVVLTLTAVVFLLFAALSAVMRQIQEVRLEDIQLVFTELTSRYQDFVDMLIKQLESAGISVDSLLEHVTSMLSDAPEALSTTLFSIIFTVYFLIDGANISAYWKRAYDILVSDKIRVHVKRMAKDAQRVFSGYLRGQFLDALLVGIEVSVVLTIVRVPYGGMIGILMGVGNLIPYLTGFVGYGTLIISCIAAGDFHKMIVGAICLAIILVVDANVVNPKLLGSTIKVHPLLVIVSLIAGGTIGGILGMLVAVPVGAFIKLQFDYFLEQRRQEKLYAQAQAGEKCVQLTADSEQLACTAAADSEQLARTAAADREQPASTEDGADQG
ncbi:MAG: AI-2E family transporter [Atopobiaceae bacterium]